MKRINWTLFDGWSSEKAWFLGVFYGDGNVYSKNGTHRVSAAGCASTMHRWAALLSEDVKPQSFKRSPKTYQAYLDSKKLVAWFTSELGICGPKHDTLTWPKALPDQYVAHFLRGVWDSDGSLHWVTETSSSGTYRYPAASVAMNAESFVRRVKTELETRLALTPVGFDMTAKARKIRYRAAPAVKVAHYLYSNAPEHLRNEDRYEVYLDFKAWKARKDAQTCVCGLPAVKHGMCDACWWAARPRTTGPGTTCACGKPILAKGLCTACYNRERRAKAGYERKSTGTCACGKPAYRKGLCDACYSRERRLQSRGR